MLSTKQLSIAVFVVGLLLFIFSLIHLNSPAKPQLALRTSLIDRDVAISEALREGKKEFSYTSRFIPGIGFINNPDAFVQNWQKTNPPPAKQK